MGVGSIEFCPPDRVSEEGKHIAVMHQPQHVLDRVLGHLNAVFEDLRNELNRLESLAIKAYVQKCGVELLCAVQQELVVQEPGFCQWGAICIAEKVPSVPQPAAPYQVVTV